MKNNPTNFIFGIALILASAPMTRAEVSTAEARQIAEDAYIYGYPLVTMEMTRRVITNVREPEGTHVPMGQLARLREYPTPDFHEVVAPNADTLYTSGFVDVGKEPWILSLPDAHGRYYLFPMLSGWTDVFQVPGKRTTGTVAQKYAITGPGWTGTLPAGVKEYKSPTAMVWLIGRIYCTGTPEDYAKVHAMQDQCTLVPLSSYGKPYTPTPGKVDPSIDMKASIKEVVERLDTESYFKLLAELMKDNPPSVADAPMVARMAKIGIVPGQPFDINKLGPDTAKALQDIPKTSLEKIVAYFKKAGTDENGWVFTTRTGLYGTHYLDRALIAVFGLGANRPQDAIYPTSKTDAAGQPYDGANKYVIHFDSIKDLPPVDGFWSLTMYTSEMFFVENPLKRYTLSSRNKFNTNPDGSLDLYVQHDSPGSGKEANWLPAPADKFALMFRFYWPKEQILHGSWKVPAVNKASGEIVPSAAGAERKPEQDKKEN
jgi:hypothetical protein